MDFQLRPLALTDLESFVRHANNFNIAKNLRDGFPHPYTLEDGKKFIERQAAANPTSVFGIEVEGNVVGGIGLHLQDDIMRKNAELGYWLGEPFWGQGIVSQAIRQMVDYGFRTFDIVRIFATPFGSNLASQRVLEKAGFKLEARLDKTIFKNGVFDDELIYAVRKP